MSMRYASRVDVNQEQIVKELRDLGFDVDIVSREKKMYDVVVSGVPTWSRRACGVRVEIKADTKAPLTPYEAEYWARQRSRDNLIRAHCTDDILRWFGRVS
jgi:hypothetical protein